MALLDLQTMELSTEAEEMGPMDSGQSNSCSN
ncbi:SapB/AmfS family lanthipeptide, partial [Kitasatospora acidiphila]|nr:hypothetical protein [Kitasatospora sp. GP30]